MRRLFSEPRRRNATTPIDTGFTTPSPNRIYDSKAARRITQVFEKDSVNRERNRYRLHRTPIRRFISTVHSYIYFPNNRRIRQRDPRGNGVTFLSYKVTRLFWCRSTFCFFAYRFAAYYLHLCPSRSLLITGRVFVSVSSFRFVHR